MRINTFNAGMKFGNFTQVTEFSFSFFFFLLNPFIVKCSLKIWVKTKQYPIIRSNSHRIGHFNEGNKISFICSLCDLWIVRLVKSWNNDLFNKSLSILNHLSLNLIWKIITIQCLDIHFQCVHSATFLKLVTNILHTGNISQLFFVIDKCTFCYSRPRMLVN